VYDIAWNKIRKENKMAMNPDGGVANPVTEQHTIRDTLSSIHKQLTEIEGSLCELAGPQVSEDKAREEPTSTMEHVSTSLECIESRVRGIKERIDFVRSMLG
jgi:hypothetical protein